VTGDGGADSMHQFQVERRSDRTKCCRKMKQRQRARLRSMGRKRDMVQRRDDVSRRRGGTREGTERRQRQLG
jgi:hypothetical protein